MVNIYQSEDLLKQCIPFMCLKCDYLQIINGSPLLLKIPTSTIGTKFRKQQIMIWKASLKFATCSNWETHAVHYYIPSWFPA